MSGINQIKSKDGRLYFYNTDLKIWQSIGDVGGAANLPDDVKSQLAQQKEDAKALLVELEDITK